MQMPGSILIYGHDGNLLDTRRLILESRGYRVYSTTDEDALGSLLDRNTFNLLIVCHSVPTDDCSGILSHVTAQKPSLKTLFLNAGGIGCHMQMLSSVFDTLCGPAKLILAVDTIMGAIPVAPPRMEPSARTERHSHMKP